jgi:hypothetical protein
MLPVSIRRSTISVIILLCLLTSSDVTSKAAPLNLRNAAIVGLQDDSLPAKAAAMLTDEIAKRTGFVSQSSALVPNRDLPTSRFTRWRVGAMPNFLRALILRTLPMAMRSGSTNLARVQP